jgi:hypothetical protein
VNPHEVKHWIDPNIIPYGWGLFKEEDEVKVEDKGQDTGQNITEVTSIVRPLSWSGHRSEQC